MLSRAVHNDVMHSENRKKTKLEKRKLCTLVVCMHAYTMHACMYACMHASMHKCACMHIPTHACTCAHTCTHACMHTHVHMFMHVHVQHACMRACMRAYASSLLIICFFLARAVHGDSMHSANKEEGKTKCLA